MDSYAVCSGSREKWTSSCGCTGNCQLCGTGSWSRFVAFVVFQVNIFWGAGTLTSMLGLFWKVATCTERHFLVTSASVLSTEAGQVHICTSDFIIFASRFWHEPDFVFLHWYAIHVKGPCMLLLAPTIGEMAQSLVQCHSEQMQYRHE